MAVNKSLPCPLCGMKIQRLEMSMIRNSLIAEHLRVTHKRTPDEIMVLMDKYTLPLESDEPQIKLPMMLGYYATPGELERALATWCKVCGYIHNGTNGPFQFVPCDECGHVHGQYSPPVHYR